MLITKGMERAARKLAPLMSAVRRATRIFSASKMKSKDI
jgi:hypothetical protein